MPQVGVPPAPPEGWTAPLTPWGDPDFRGTYPLDLGRTPMQRPERFGTRGWYTDEEYEQAVEQAEFVEGGADREDQANKLGSGNWFEYGRTLRQTSLIVEPADGRIKMNDEGRRRAAGMKSSWSEEVFESRDDFNSLDHCITRGLPASMIPFPYNNGLRIFQSPGKVVINLEMIHETRVIDLTRKEHLPAEITPWLGDSIGHWEDNTLVVETANFTGEAPMVIVGPSNQPIPTSKSMKITEHYTLYGPEQVFYEAWIEDPEVLAEPFKMGFPWRRDDSYQPFEYACHEGNTLVRAYIVATSPRFEEYRKANGGS
ncbi:MAG TPA: hypothetical protein VLA37_14530 [Sphingomonadaceae bacterium]|nr:hypothetical protein [Sphingomonadaceae bacterium]